MLFLVDDLQFNSFTVDMTVPDSPDEQKCQGIVDQAGHAEGEVGGMIMDVMKRAALKVLGTLVVGEKKIIEKGPITIHSALYVFCWRQ